MDDSSIYFFNAPNIISRYTLGNGVVVPVFNDPMALPSAPAAAPAVSPYKDEAMVPDGVYRGLSR